MVVHTITKNEANGFFQQYEHLGNCGLGVWHYGCYENDLLLAVVSFGPVCFNPKRSSIGTFAAANGMRIVQLTRGGTRFDAPKNTPSRAVALALKAIRNRLGDVVVVAYSDTSWNEIGTIYQASNFMYLGTTNPKGQADYVIDGERMSGWTVRKKYGTRDIQKLKSVVRSVEKTNLSQKHVYVFINAGVTKKAKAYRWFEKQILPYPSRASLNVDSMLAIRERVILKRKTS